MSVNLKIYDIEASPYNLYPGGEVIGMIFGFKFDKSDLPVFTQEFAVGRLVELHLNGTPITGMVANSSYSETVCNRYKAKVNIKTREPEKVSKLDIQTRIRYTLFECVDATGMEDVLTEGYSYPLRRLFGDMAEVIVDGEKYEVFKERFKECTND